MNLNVYIVKADGEREKFDPNKLMDSLLRSGAEKKISESIVKEISENINPEESTDKIYRKAFSLLKKKEKNNYISSKYSLRRAIFEMGPTGFPFEILVSELFKDRGYETTVGVNVLGKCAEHEIDVLAKKNKELIYIEAKFHNDRKLKSDLKVSLYIKARFEDLIIENKNINNDFKKKDFWLITNTKFTSSALRFGKCANLKMIGWNFPKEGNLQDMIEESNLHPITCLHNLTSGMKKSLLKNNIVLCRQILKDKNSLKKIGLDEKKIDKVYNEIEAMCKK